MEKVGAVVVIRRPMVTGAPLGVTLVGVNAQVTPEGSVPQLGVIGRLKSFNGVIVRRTDPICPCLRVRLEGLAVTVKSAGDVIVSVKAVD